VCTFSNDVTFWRNAVCYVLARFVLRKRTFKFLGALFEAFAITVECTNLSEILVSYVKTHSAMYNLDMYVFWRSTRKLLLVGNPNK
jgi:hypothetical protein